MDSGPESTLRDYHNGANIEEGELHEDGSIPDIDASVNAPAPVNDVKVVAPVVALPQEAPPEPVLPSKKRILPRSACISDFEIIEKVGEGTFGEVYKARQKKTGKMVALKKILSRAEQEGVLLGDGVKVEGVYMVFIFMDHDLTGLLENSEAEFTLPQIKCYFQQLLFGMQYLHSRGILHRDVKGSNLLINNRGELRVTDFGLARPMEEGRKEYTPGVVTRWYRPPELLFGATEYGKAADMWGVGCILGEMFLRKPLFNGDGDFSQLEQISKLCGTPNNENMPEHEKYPLFKKIKLPQHRRLIMSHFQKIDPLARDLLDKLLVLDPAKRLTAEEALTHAFFTTEPLPAAPKSIPAYKSSHEFTRNAAHGAHQPHPTPQEYARRPASYRDLDGQTKKSPRPAIEYYSDARSRDLHEERRRRSRSPPSERRRSTDTFIPSREPYRDSRTRSRERDYHEHRDSRDYQQHRDRDHRRYEQGGRDSHHADRERHPEGRREDPLLQSRRRPTSYADMYDSHSAHPDSASSDHRR